MERAARQTAGRPEEGVPGSTSCSGDQLIWLTVAGDCRARVDPSASEEYELEVIPQAPIIHDDGRALLNSVLAATGNVDLMAQLLRHPSKFGIYVV